MTVKMGPLTAPASGATTMVKLITEHAARALVINLRRTFIATSSAALGVLGYRRESVTVTPNGRTSTGQKQVITAGRRRSPEQADLMLMFVALSAYVNILSS
jgi:hypothetical protein